MIFSFQSHQPQQAEGVWIAPQASVIGQVDLGESVSVWPGAVILGDVHQIKIGRYTNVQDLAMLHVTHPSPYTQSQGYALTIGEYVTIGHHATLHGCSIGDRVLIGIQSVVLDGAEIESDVLIGACSLVPPKKRLASGFLYLGNPVKAVRPLTEEEKSFLVYSAQHYVSLKNLYKSAVQPVQ